MNRFENLAPTPPLRNAFSFPDWWELFLFGALAATNYFAWNSTPVEAIGIAFLFVFLWPRGSEFAALYGRHRWPHEPGKQKIPVWIGRALLFLVLLGGIRWDKVARHRVDWPTVGTNAWGVAAFGVFMLVLLAPLMWLLDRIFKPWAKSKNQGFVGALIFIALCGVWWMIVICGTIYLGLGQVIFGDPPR